MNVLSQSISRSIAGSYPRFLTVQNAVMCLYVVALATTMSGMELFSTLACLGAVGGMLWLKPPDLKAPPLALPLGLFALAVGLSVTFGTASLDQKLYDVSRMRFFLLFAGLYYHLKYFSLEGPWRKALFWAAAVVGVYGVFQHFIPLDLVRPEGKKIFRYAIQDEKIGPLVIGAFNHHLTFSNVYLFFACLSLGWGFSGRKWGFALAALLFLDVLWTGSRIALVAVPLAVVGVAARKSRRTAFVVLVAGAVGLAAVILTNDGIRERVVRTVSGSDAQYDLGPRTRLWHANWVLFTENPWFGVGYNHNERVIAPYVDRLYPGRENFYGHAHSLPLQILASTGIVGALAFLYLWVSVLRLAWRAHRMAPPDSRTYWETWALGVAWVGFTVQGLSQWNFGDAEVLHTVIFFWAVLAALHDKVCGDLPPQV